MKPLLSDWSRAFLFGASALCFTPPAAVAQKVPPQELEVSSPSGCRALADKLIGRGDGGQWLVGDRIQLSGRLNSLTAMTVLNNQMRHVTCYNKSTFNGREKVFVVSDDKSVCGWVDRTALLSDNALSNPAGQSSPDTPTCENPRAMFFQNYCARINPSGQGKVDEECQGVPQRLRTKGVLIGSTAESPDRPRYPMLSAPVGGQPRDAKSFFSVLEVHDVQKGAQGAPMLLVGDGAGELFGWIDRRALQLWPTRLSLYYDDSSAGQMFTRESSMKENYRAGKPEADISFAGSPDDLKSFLHGSLPLVAYPIVRTIDPTNDPLQPRNQPLWHEVIFIGKTGEGEASRLIDQARLSDKIQKIRQVNVVFAIDTTESMTEYLPYIRQGIATFVRNYNRNVLDQSQRLPEMRLSVVAYSDYLNKARMKLGDPIKTEVLMPPTTIGPEQDVSSVLEKIEAHKGLSDDVGEYEEAGLEAIVQMLRKFDEPRVWFDGGPRIVIHIGDHGSRSTLQLDEVARELARYRTYYLPIAVITDDKADASRVEARGRFARQALQTLAPLVELDGKSRAQMSDVDTINLSDRNKATAAAVVKTLDFVVEKVTQAINLQRGNYGFSSGDGSSSRQARSGGNANLSATALDRATSRIRLDEAIEKQYGLTDSTRKAMAQADKAFAPVNYRRDGTAQTVNWNYFVAFEPKQLEVLQPVLNELCALSGRPDRRARFRALIVRMAEIFSGDQIIKNEEMVAILSELATLPGVRGSFLSIPGQQLLQQIDSEDPKIQLQLRRDVCWVSYHLNNVATGHYVQPQDLGWDPNSSKFTLRPGRTVRARNYRFVPLVGAETIYLPSWMFVVPSQVGELKSGTGCTGWTCN